MDRDAAIQLVNDWHKLPNTSEVPKAYERLGRALWTLLPDDIRATGTALVDDVPTVLALNEASVFVVNIDPGNGDDARVRLRRLPVVPDAMTVTLVDDRAGNLSDSAVGAHLREWTFHWDNGEKLQFSSLMKVYDGWSDAPGSVELFSQALAAACGWALPGDGR